MRKKINKLVYLLLLLTLAACQFGKKDGQYKKHKPNVLFLFADDHQAAAIHSLGNNYIKTPNIDRLVEKGVSFVNTYCMGSQHAAVCAPSRAMLMSGKSLFHVYENLENVETMPQYFGENGYLTFGTGKWHNTASSFEKSFQQGKDIFLQGMSDHYKVPCRNFDENHKLGNPVEKGFSTDVFADAAINFLKEYVIGEQDKPFFCYVAFTAPHDPRSPKDGYIGLYPDESMPVPPNLMKYHPFDYGQMDIRDENLIPWPRTSEMIKKSVADYYALITHLDHRVGDILNLLEESGLSENTIVVYAADNGLALGSHGLIGKQSLYEHSMKVPLIIHAPGMDKGMKTEALSYLYDIFPTLCNFCNLNIPDGVDGKSLLPVIQGTMKGVRDELFTTYRHTIRAVRTDAWKLIVYPERGVKQLYNLKSDPYELLNLAEVDSCSQILQHMTELLAEKQSEYGDTLNLFPTHTLPKEYDPTQFERKPDQFQPEYVLERYFRN